MTSTQNSNSNAVQAALTYYDTRKQWMDAEQYSKVSNVRRDPRKNSTTAFHLKGRGGELDHTGRPLGDQRTFFLGPGPLIVGGQMRYSYPEKSTGKVKLDQSLDPREILNTYGRGMLSKEGQGDTLETAASSGRFKSRPSTAPTGRRSWSSEGGSLRPRAADVPKAIWNDGRGVHVLEGVSPIMSPTGRPGDLQTSWTPPRVQHKHLEQTNGANLGQVEMPGGSGTKVIGSKTRYIPLTADPPPPRDVQTASAELLGRQSLANSVRSYALAHKPMGYKEYEARARGMEGLNAWDATGGPTTSSMRLGRPSMLLGPSQHFTERLSLRSRPATTRPGW
ncbi:hypothetical protein DUNSADRAFT_11482 [Dunaliella salina]|uniref:Flagellar associated protein n=1 Tax=Dunaliella salina TaxID=3046 RepID=A0ABQ7GD98_DUNSA|nr:hypothetical protein DUNSADRAFT_11482 [Dunaliella salina]|eukprot:KAF5832582.1 hypothetical protein DUNSADRAFT_11482 [Dunaliella salina]